MTSYSAKSQLLFITTILTFKTSTTWGTLYYIFRLDLWFKRQLCLPQTTVLCADPGKTPLRWLLPSDAYLLLITTDFSVPPNKHHTWTSVTVKQRFLFNGIGLLQITANFLATAENQKLQVLNSNISHEWTMNRIFEGFLNFHFTFDKLCFLHLICLKLSTKLPQNSLSTQMVFPSQSLKLSTFLAQESMPKAT